MKTNIKKEIKLIQREASRAANESAGGFFLVSIIVVILGLAVIEIISKSREGIMSLIN